MQANCNVVAAALSPSVWLPAHLDALVRSPDVDIPTIAPSLPRPLLPGLDLWDMWPAQDADGQVVRFDGAVLWFILSAPRLDDPDARHGVARIRLLTELHGIWRDHGNAFPDGFTPGSREWAGSAVFDPQSGLMTLYFTAAGERGDGAISWAQRIFACSGPLTIDDGQVSIQWTSPEEIIVADNRRYRRVDATVGEPGFIKGFRDPAYFRDPATGIGYMLFTASMVAAHSTHDGAIGIAVEDAEGNWALMPPLLTMDGVNNEPERPHLLWRDGRYYLFFSTQQRMFAPDVAAGPNGLYAMVADRVDGPYRPVNGSGLVAANPQHAPHQAYSWWVTPDLAVYGFADILAPADTAAQDNADWRRAHFGGVPAPVFRLALAGDTGRVIAG